MECEGGEIIWTSRDDTLPDRVTLRPLGKRARHLKLPTLTHKDRHGSLNAFIQAITTGQEPTSSGRNNLKTLKLMFATIEAAQSGNPVIIPQRT